MRKYAIITGVSKGIGLAIAERAQAGGLHIVGCASSAGSVSAATSRLPQADLQQVDVADKAALQGWLTQVLTQHGAPALAVNNAGVFLPGTIHEEDDEVFERQMALNVAGSYYFAKAVTRAMKTAGTGTLVNIASTASIKTYPNGGSYAMSKAAMLSMGRGLREELKPYGVRVVNLLPGPVRTASWDGIDLPDDRFMAPADIAEAAWLAYSLPPTTVIEEMLLRPQLGDIGA